MSRIDSISNTDLFTLCDQLEAQSVDMILADLPYGTTACSWDTVIPFAPMWERFKRVIKPRGAIVLTASQPFTSALVMSNVEMFRYEWVWDKANHSNPFIANTQPLRVHESVVVFGHGAEVYYPQMREGEWDKKGGYASRLWAGGDKATFGNLYFPTSILDIPTGGKYNYLHPTQKPVALFEYLIRTYTREGDVVLDPVCGSGTTALAARNAKRHWICGDTDAHYCDVARDRLRLPFEAKRVKASDDVSDLPLFAQEVQP